MTAQVDDLFIALKGAPWTILECKVNLLDGTWEGGPVIYKSLPDLLQLFKWFEIWYG